MPIMIKPPGRGLEEGIGAPRLGLAGARLPRRTGRLPAATAKALLGVASVGGSGGNGEAPHVQQLFAGTGVSAAQGPSVEELLQLHGPPAAAWAPHPRVRRHLRRRHIDADLPAKNTMAAEQEQAQQPQASAQPSAVDQQQQTLAAMAPVAAAAQAAPEQPAVQMVQVAAAAVAPKQLAETVQPRSSIMEQQAVQQPVQAAAAPQPSVQQHEAVTSGAEQAPQQPAAQATVQQAATAAAILPPQQAATAAAILPPQQQLALPSQKPVRVVKCHQPQLEKLQRRQVATAEPQQAAQAQEQAGQVEGRQAHLAAAPVPSQQLGPASAASPVMHGSVAQWAVATVVAVMAVAVGAMRWARARRRSMRSATDEIKEAEARARAARVYDRTRQRFQRALVAAEDLEAGATASIDSSVFTAVSRISKQRAGEEEAEGGAEADIVQPLPALAAATAVAAAGAATAEGRVAVLHTSAGSSSSMDANPHSVPLAPLAAAGDAVEIDAAVVEAGLAASLAPAGAHASMDGTTQSVSMASMDGSFFDDDDVEGTDVFDPASWDEETRKQWESFVSSSKVNKGKLWDSSVVDEGLPEVWVDLNR